MVVSLTMAMACASEEGGDEVVTRITSGTSSTASSYYVAEVGYAQIINKYNPDIEVTVVESGGSGFNIPQLGKGYIQMTGGNSIATHTRAYNGLDKPEYAANPPKYLRALVLEVSAGTFVFTRQDAGINNVTDLNGKPFYFGRTGSSTELVGKAVFDGWGIKVDEFVGGYTDALAALKDGRIIGFLKDESVGVPSYAAELIEVNTFTPLKVVPPTPDQLATSLKAYVGNVKACRDAGTLPGINTEACTYGSAYAHMVSSETMSQEIGYKIAKTTHQHWDELCAHAPVVPCDVDCIRDLITGMGEVPNVLPLHAGTVQYAKEIGVDVPVNLIPPEYKG
jgi:hypothetical protein